MRSLTRRERFGSFVAVVLLALICAIPADATGPTIHAGGFACFSNSNAPIKNSERGYWCNGDTPNFRKADGTDIALGSGSSGYSTIDNAGTPLTQRLTLNFTGAGISCVDNAGSTRTDCTVSGGGSTGNWSFSGGGADLSSGTSMYVGSTSGTTGVATSVVIGQQNGATVWLGSNAGSGTTFTKTLDQFYMDATAASAGTQTVSAPAFHMRPHYWNGSVDTTYALDLQGIMDTTGPAAHLGFKWNGSELFQFTSGKALNLAANGSIGSISQAATNTTGLTIKSNVADGATSVGVVIDNTTTLATAGSHTLSLRNGGVEWAYFDPNIPSFQFTSGSSGSIGNAAIRLNFTGANMQAHGGIAPDADNAYPLGGGGNRWLGIYNSGPVINGRNVQSGTTYTAVATDYYVAMSNTAARTVTLPAASGVTAGWTLVVKDTACTASTANVTIARAGSDTIIGTTTAQTSVVINTNGGTAWLVSDGVSKWEKIN